MNKQKGVDFLDSITIDWLIDNEPTIFEKVTPPQYGNEFLSFGGGCYVYTETTRVEIRDPAIIRMSGMGDAAYPCDTLVELVGEYLRLINL